MKLIYSDHKRYSIFKKVTLYVSVLLLVVISFSAGMYLSQKNEVVKGFAKQEVVYLGKVIGKYSVAPNGKLSSDVDFTQFWEVWDKLQKDYVDHDKINEKELFYGAIKGMVAAIGDPYTVFMDPKISVDFNNDLQGKFEGIGAEIGMKNELITVIAPLPDMPAEKAGLRAGDKIISIGEKNTQGMTVEQAVSQIRGPKGTEVKLTIYREGMNSPQEMNIKRDTITVKSVRTRTEKDNIFVIEITNFNDDTASGFNDAVSKALEKNPKGIILDMRNNPGGYLETAIEVASEWIEEGVVVSEQYSKDCSEATDLCKNDHLARGRARLKGFPTAVLVNEGSASASEIVAGALQDTKNAIVVGKQSFGKGSVQSLENLSDGSSVKITVAKWLTPGGKNINESGITPDLTVEFTESDYNAGKDPQLNAAISTLKDGLEKAKIIYSTSTPEKATSTEK